LIAALSPASSLQPIGIESVGQRFDPESCEQGMRQRVAGQPEYGAEAARIAQPQGHSPSLDGEYQVEMIVLVGGKRGGDQTQAARHAEVDQQMTVAEVEQQVFAAPVDGRQTTPAEGSFQVLGQRIAQRMRPGNHAGDGVPGQRRGDAATGDFDLGQFRHAGPRAKHLAKLLTSPHCMRQQCCPQVPRP
jgi:hypothetical protein